MSTKDSYNDGRLVVYSGEIQYGQKKRKHGPCRGRCRWNILMTLTLFVIPVLIFFTSIWHVLAFNYALTLLWIMFTVCALVNLCRFSSHFKEAKRTKAGKFSQSINEEEAYRRNSSKYSYVYTTFMYKEPHDLLFQCIEMMK